MVRDFRHLTVRTGTLSYDRVGPTAVLDKILVDDRDLGNARMTLSQRLVARLSLVAVLASVAHTVDAAVTEYVHTDALGSIIAISDSNRTLAKRREYEPFGEQLTPAGQNGPGYTGHVQDATTGLTYMQQRYYDQGIGRFLSADPVAADQNTGTNFHRYWYANNNPYKFTDPDGREATLNYTRPGTDEYRVAVKYENGPNELSASGHGASTHITDDRNFDGENDDTRNRLSPEQLANDFLSHPDYSPDATLVILSCNAGNGDNSLAQRVADITGNRVEASTGLMEGNPDTGDFVPFNDLNNNERRDPGEWMPQRAVFVPREPDSIH